MKLKLFYVSHVCISMMFSSRVADIRQDEWSIAKGRLFHVDEVSASLVLGIVGNIQIGCVK